jgi:nucleotide-binding universal stress UspA family protein
MEETSTWKKITWAVDLFASLEIQCSALSAIRLMIGDSDVPIEPIYILNRSPIGIASPLPREAVEKVVLMAREKFKALCTPEEKSHTLPLKIVSGHFPTRHTGAQALITEALRSGSDLIVASTHAKSGPIRWFTGSFAETLMLYSNLPLLIVNPLWKRTLTQRGILFPTDFSDESRAAFDLAIDLAKRTKSAITIFHKIPFLITPIYELAGFPIYDQVYETQLGVEDAQRKGVTARMELQTTLAGSPAGSILAYAEGKDYLIAMAARSGPLAAALLGSTTREVVRGASNPVWVVHPIPTDRTELNPLFTLSDAEILEDLTLHGQEKESA